MFATIKRAFRKLDTSEADAAIALAARQHQEVRVRARALRMDVSCADPVAALGRIACAVQHHAGPVLRNLYPPPHGTPAEMQRALGSLEGVPHGPGTGVARRRAE